MKNLEKYFINFDELKKGDTLWCAMLGSVYIKNISFGDYPIIVTNEKDEIAYYNKKGFFASWAKNPTLFKSCPYDDLKEEPRMIEVWFDREWKERKAIGFFDEYAIVMNPKVDIPYLTNNWREIQPKELTDKERITELEKEVAELKKKLQPTPSFCNDNLQFTIPLTNR